MGGAFARKAHSKESKAVAGDVVAGKFAARCVGVITHRKIAGSKLRRAIKCADLFQNIVMTFGEVVGNSKGRSNGLPVNNTDFRLSESWDCSHDGRLR
ncbi:hypothetical protein B6J79_26165 [Salmonella enterica]|nr:hypothetical protein [Salmonella enterica]